jgi:hypothetical protein
MAEMPDTVGPSHVAIQGGRFAAGQLGEFLTAWQLPRRGMPCAVWEWVHRIDFTDGSLPADLDLLERGVVFGPEGSLSLRRDGEDVRWHFVGEPTVSPPAEFLGVDFWERHGQVRFRRREVRLLLWGKAVQGSAEWTEDRVRRARLRYPAAGERVQIVAWQFTEAGVEAFTWWRGLEEHRHEG